MLNYYDLLTDFDLFFLPQKVFDFELNQEDMKTILGFNKNFRACPMQWWVCFIGFPGYGHQGILEMLWKLIKSWKKLSLNVFNIN